MKLLIKRCVLTIIFILFSVSITKAESIDIYEQQKIQSHLLVNLFMEQIAKDGLTIFGHKIDQSDLHSHHVAYVHDTVNDSLKVQLCFTLSDPIAVPDFDSFYVNRITVDVDKDGHIIEISTHVFPKEMEEHKAD